LHQICAYRLCCCSDCSTSRRGMHLLVVATVLALLNHVLLAPCHVHAYNPGTKWWNRYAFAALKTDGTVLAWGSQTRGANEPTSSLTNIIGIYSTDQAFVALKNDGSLITWGDSQFGGNQPTPALSRVVNIACAQKAFAALTYDGKIYAWGDSVRGGTVPSSGFSTNTYLDIYSTAISFSATYGNGQVASWGAIDYTGGVLAAPSGLAGVVKIFTNLMSFAALKSDGSIVAWPSGPNGGTAPVLSNVAKVFANGMCVKEK